jgi:hypothetical protein
LCPIVLIWAIPTGVTRRFLENFAGDRSQSHRTDLGQRILPPRRGQGIEPGASAPGKQPPFFQEAPVGAQARNAGASELPPSLRDFKRRKKVPAPGVETPGSTPLPLRGAYKPNPESHRTDLVHSDRYRDGIFLESDFACLSQSHCTHLGSSILLNAVREIPELQRLVAIPPH